MTNIEIKAKCDDLERARKHLNSLGAGLAGSFRQKDTYFNVAEGRLKLRELDQDEGHMIFYQRDDVPGPKRSDYELAFTSDPEAMGAIMGRVLGASVEVEKNRQVWLWENVRIHLDQVRDLGTFVELEAVTDEKNIEESHQRIETLMRALEIEPEELLEGSYADLIAAAGQGGE